MKDKFTGFSLKEIHRLVICIVVSVFVVSGCSTVGNGSSSENAAALDSGAGTSDDFDSLLGSSEATKQETKGDSSVSAATDLAPVEAQPQDDPLLAETKTDSLQKSEATPSVDNFAEFNDQNLKQDFPAPTESSQTQPPMQTSSVSESSEIKNLKYRNNSQGGAVIVEGSKPLSYQIRKNTSTNQFIVELPQANLPSKLTRPLITKDMNGSIGSIDAYNSKSGQGVRIVVQMKDGTFEPQVVQEGNSLYISAVNSGSSVASGPSGNSGQVAVGASSAEKISTDGNGAPLLENQSLEEFLSNNNKFQGKKMSIEAVEMDLREFFKLITDESGANLVIDESVKGTVTLKLRQVPWDQVLVMVLRSKKLGYIRLGNVIRIAQMADILKEEEEAIKTADLKRGQAPMEVKMVPISYADLGKIKEQVTPFLSPRGKIILEDRTSALVVQDMRENIERIQKMIRAIDVPPPQVLIEGKVIEATDTFAKSFGINWNMTGENRSLAHGIGGRNIVGGLTSLNMSPGVSGAVMSLNFSAGSFAYLGDLGAQIGLAENEGTAKVISSPRVLTMHNQAASIKQSTSIPIITTQTAGAGATPTQTVQYKDVSLSLDVTPQVTNDASVVMSVSVNRDFVAPGAGDGGAPPINSRSAKTKVLVKSGHTAVIGGIYQNDTTESSAKVPLLADIPILGWLFKNKNKSNSRNELLIFLTPRIVGSSEVFVGGGDLSRLGGDSGSGSESGSESGEVK